LLQFLAKKVRTLSMPLLLNNTNRPASHLPVR
jgi:hypothetical protein